MHLCYTGNTELGRTTYLVSAMHRNEVAYEDDIPYKARGTGTDRACESIKTSGELAYHFLLDIDFAQLDSLKLESELKEKHG